jgi:hypothetical protein
MPATDERNETNEFWRVVKDERRNGNAGRVSEALAAKDEIVQWCADLGIVTLQKSFGQHWRFVLPSLFIVDWWPGSGKCQVDWRDGEQTRPKQIGGWTQLRDRVLRNMIEEVGPTVTTVRVKIADELLAGTRDLALQALACGEQYSGDPAEIAIMATELRAYRAGEIVPEGMVLVDERELREYIRHHAAETCEDDENRGACERNSLEHFGLAEAQDPAHERRAGEGAGR